MKIKILSILFLIFLIIGNVNAQSYDSLFTRLNGLKNFDIDFFNVDGIEISTQKKSAKFTAKNISKKFRKYSIKENELVYSDDVINMHNYFVSKSEELCLGVIKYTSYYFIENKEGQITFITFDYSNRQDKDFERKFVSWIYNESIPDSIYYPMNLSEIDFAGRMIPMANNCNWRGVNNIQCPSFGQMNWSVHKTFDGASASVNDQFKIIESSRKGKIISNDSVGVIFEGSEVISNRIIFDITGVNSAIVGMGGAKTLTVYFVAAPVRGNFVSCVMSFWNNDRIKSSGLPALLEQVMELKQQ